MGEDRLGGILEIVRDHEGPAPHQRQGLGRPLPRQTPAGGDAEREGLVAASRLDHLEQVLEELVRDVDLGDEVYPFRAKAEVVWSCPEPSHPRHGMGLRFQKMDEEATAALCRAIERMSTEADPESET